MSKPTLLILGGAGAQNGAVTKVFSAAGDYNIRILTRSVQGKSELSSLPNVTLIEGDCFDEATLFSVFKGVDLLFVNSNGFAIGEKNELYWGVRWYEIARWTGVKHFLYSGLPYVSRNGNFDPRSRVPFVDGKAKVAQYISSMPTSPMIWSVLTTGPYAERLWEPVNVPSKEADGTYVFKLPLGPTGAMPLVDLESIGEYAKWMFEHPQRSAGLHLGIAIAHVSGPELAAAFQAVTGRRARYHEIPLQITLDRLPDRKLGSGATPGYDDPTLKTPAEHFGPWWTIFRESGGNTGLWARNYELLDDIMPNRIRTIEEWMRKRHYDGQAKQVLKTGFSYAD